MPMLSVSLVLEVALPLPLLALELPLLALLLPMLLFPLFLATPSSLLTGNGGGLIDLSTPPASPSKSTGDGISCTASPTFIPPGVVVVIVVVVVVVPPPARTRLLDLSFPVPVAAITTGDIANPMAMAMAEADAGVPRKSGVEFVDLEPRYGCLLALLLLEVLLLRVAVVPGGLGLALALGLGGAWCCCCC